MSIQEAIEVLQIEADGILHLKDRIGRQFDDLINQICASSGRVIIGGIGKSGIVGRKIVATLNSTGTRSLFLHPVEAVHGDLGMVCPDDIFLALSNSGETDELNILLPSIRRIGCKIVAFTGKRDSTLAKNSDIVIDVGVPREACPLGLAPTASTTAMLAMGDALAVVLLNRKHFNSTDFKRIHPGGALGQRLASLVRDIMLTGDAVPMVTADASIRTAIAAMDVATLGVTLVVDEKQRLEGIITDGDIRRSLMTQNDFWNLAAADVMTHHPRSMWPSASAYDALRLMELHEITVLPITEKRVVCGILHLHDILGKGEFKFNGF